MRVDLPSGTVTFVFTDVEGSTRLLDELGAEAYATALAEHRRVVRDVCGLLGGVEVDTQGDAFLLAFGRAPDALDAAGTITERLREGPIRLRMGVHTGSPLVTDEGYVGADVHRAARIAAAGHGGQVLVSAATAALVEARLRDLGEHRFKDLAAPERVFQLGEAAFPSIRSLHRSNLPVPATPFLGREQELSAVAALLGEPGVRLVSLTGPGGTGKTRLALQAAAETSDAFPDGVMWVPLAPLRDPSLVVATVLEAVGLVEEPGRSPLESLAAGLGGKRVLLVLDNGEHLMPGLAKDIAAMVAAAPALVLVVTSRERLRVESERVYAVPTLAEQDGANLFVARACALDPSFVQTPVVDEICARLDYLPLALELAAARTGLLSPEQLLERLGRRLDILKGAVDRDPRQQTLRTTIAWSYDLLTTEEQETFAAMSVFAGGCTLDSAEEVCDSDLDTLQSLLDKSLVRRRESEHGPRLWMLETIREFAAEQLADHGGEDAVRRRHLEHYGQLARDVSDRSNTVEYELDRIEAERDNLRLAFETALAVDAAQAVALGGQLGVYWSRRGHYREGREKLRASLATAPNADPLVTAKALYASGYLAQKQSDLDEGDRFAREALDLYRAGGDARGVGNSLNSLGISAWYRGDLTEAARLIEEAATEFRAAYDERGQEVALSNLAAIANASGDHQRAIEIGREIVAKTSEHGQRAMSLNNLGLAEEAAGQVEQARRSFEESIALSRRHGLTEVLPYALASLAHLELKAGSGDALRRYRESLTLLRDIEDRRGIAYCLEGVAAAQEQLGNHADAATLLGAAARIRSETGAALSQDEQTEVDTIDARCRAALSPDALERAWDGGAALDATAAAEWALRLLGGIPR